MFIGSSFPPHTIVRLIFDASHGDGAFGRLFVVKDGPVIDHKLRGKHKGWIERGLSM